MEFSSVLVCNISDACFLQVQRRGVGYGVFILVDLVKRIVGWYRA